MDEMLSKEEIDALLGVVDGKTFNSNEETEEDVSVVHESNNEMVAKDELIDETNILDEVTDKDIQLDENDVNEIINSIESDRDELEIINTTESISDEIDASDDEDTDNMILTSEEKDILGEIGNISMGTSATTLYTLLDEKVSITTPHVEITKWKKISDSYEKPCVGIKVDYKAGLKGSNALLLKEQDVKIISSIMMGNPKASEISVEEEPLTEIDLSAIAEAMNQMIGSAATSLSSLLKKKIDIETPIAQTIELEDNVFARGLGFEQEELVVRISFKMVVGDILDSNIMQVIPVDFAKDMVNILRQETSMVGDNKMNKTNIAKDDTKEKVNEPIQKQESVVTGQTPVMEQKATVTNQDLFDEVQRHRTLEQPSKNVNVSTAQFQDFGIAQFEGQKENIEIIMDVPLEVTVELGRTRKRIKDILEFSPGTIIELDKIAGDPIDILVNGKYVAKGEVVVIDENFGIRITDIINVENRI